MDILLTDFCDSNPVFPVFILILFWSPSIQRSSTHSCGRLWYLSRRPLIILLLLTFLSFTFFLLSCFPLFGSFGGMTPMMRSINLLKIDTWFGLVNKYPVISYVGHHFTSISPLWILSVTKTYLMFICLVHFLLDDLPFLAIKIALSLSWYMIFSVTP